MFSMWRIQGFAEYGREPDFVPSQILWERCKLPSGIWRESSATNTTISVFWKNAFFGIVYESP